MDQKHKELAEELYTTAIFALAEKGMESPLFVLIKDNKTVPLLIPPGYDVSVGDYAIMANNAAIEIDADAIMLVSAMWVVIDKAKNLEGNLTRPSEHPNKEHYLNLIYMTADGQTLESIAGKVETDPLGHEFVKKQEWIEAMQDFNFLQAWK